MPSAKPLIDTSAESIREAQNKTHCLPLHDVKIEAISSTLFEVEVSKVVVTWVNSVARVEIRTVYNKPGKIRGGSTNKHAK